MENEKINLIKNYINKIEDAVRKYNYSTKDRENEQKLFEVIVEIVNVLSGEISDLENIVLLKSETVERDANSIIGKLKLYLANKGAKIENNQLDSTIQRFGKSLILWFDREVPGTEILRPEYEEWDNWDNCYNVIDYDYEYNLNLGIPYPENMKSECYQFSDIKEFIEMAYSYWVRNEKHYDFTVQINKRLEKFNLPYKLQNGKLIERGYKSSHKISNIYNYSMFERKIQYAEEMITSKELLDKKCALDYIVDSLQYLISVQNEMQVKRKYACAAKEVSNDDNSKKYTVIKNELEEIMKIANEYFDIRHNEYLNKAKETREVIDDSMFIEYLYNRIYGLLYLLRLKINKENLITNNMKNQ